MQIKILGTGCPKCNSLTERTKAAAAELDLDYEFEKVTDINEIIAFGVMMTPALVVDGVIKVSGKVPTVEELKTFLR